MGERLAVRRMVRLAELAPSEDVQDVARVAAIVANLSADPEDYAWDDQPALIVDRDGNLLDGHHRYRAALAVGLPAWPAIVVDRAAWDAQGAHHRAALWACDEAGDDVTWGSLHSVYGG